MNLATQKTPACSKYIISISAGTFTRLGLKLIPSHEPDQHSSIPLSPLLQNHLCSAANELLTAELFQQKPDDQDLSSDALCVLHMDCRSEMRFAEAYPHQHQWISLGCHCSVLNLSQTFSEALHLTGRERRTRTSSGNINSLNYGIRILAL